LSTPKLGRNARLFKDGVVIGYAKDISMKASADLIKEYSMDSLAPASACAKHQRFKEELQSAGISPLEKRQTTSNALVMQILRRWLNW